MLAKITLTLMTTAAIGLLTAADARAQGPHGHGRNGRGPAGGNGASMAADHDAIHFLLDHHDVVRRTVTQRDDGVETLTESEDPQIAETIREHVAAMSRRVERRQPIRMRDPLFAEVFRHADKIKISIEKTKHGIRVVETSDDPYVAKLIKAHAAVVSQFAARGYAEAHRNHPVPNRDEKFANEASVPEELAEPACGGVCPHEEEGASDSTPPCANEGCAGEQCASDGSPRGACPNKASCAADHAPME